MTCQWEVNVDFYHEVRANKRATMTQTVDTIEQEEIALQHTVHWFLLRKWLRSTQSNQGNHANQSVSPTVF